MKESPAGTRTGREGPASGWPPVGAWRGSVHASVCGWEHEFPYLPHEWQGPDSPESRSFGRRKIRRSEDQGHPKDHLPKSQSLPSQRIGAREQVRAKTVEGGRRQLLGGCAGLREPL